MGRGATLFLFLSAVFICGQTMLLLREYQFLCVQSQRLVELQGRYKMYIKAFRQKMREHTPMQHAPLLYGQLSLTGTQKVLNPGFNTINREPTYLEQAAVEYLRDQRVETMIAHADAHLAQTMQPEVVISAAPQEHIPKKKSTDVKNNAPAPSATRSDQRQKTVRAVKRSMFVWPLEQHQFWLSSFFGPRKKPNGSWGFHYGIDMAAVRGTPVKAAAAGTVIEARYVSGYGNTVVIAHSALYKTRYAHLDSIAVQEKQTIKQSDLVGTVGDTGFTIKAGTDASHLHFEVYERGKQVNPLPLLQM